MRRVQSRLLQSCNLKSTAQFGLLSAYEAVWVRYVEARWNVTLSHFLFGLLNWVWSAVVLFCVVYVLAWTANFHGWGKPVLHTSADDLRHRQAMRSTRKVEQKKKSQPAWYSYRLC
jgi:hypothetical protein